MQLTLVFRAHAISAIVFVPFLILAPHWLATILTGEVLRSAGAAFAQLYGAAILLVAIVTWRAASMTSTDARRTIALSMFVYESLGAVIGLALNFPGHAIGKWLTVVTYLAFALAYAYLLFIAHAE